MTLTPEQLAIKSEVIDLYSYYAQGLDAKQWDVVRNCFADEIYIDYGAISESTGGPDVPRLADDWLKYLQVAINGFDITRHTITNHRLAWAEDSVSCQAYMMADHIIFEDPADPVAHEGNTVTVVGEYTNVCKNIGGSWKIVKSALVVNWTRGDRGLFEQAAHRALEASA